MILIVDDHEPNRTLLERRLASAGYENISVDGGRAALDYVHSNSVDLILLDLMMPEMDGFEVLQELRKNHSSSSLPVVIVTAKNDSDDVVQGLSMGANDFVTKPIEFPVLFARIENQLACLRSEQNWQELNNALEAKVAERTQALRATNDALSHSEERYRSLYEDSPAIFLSVLPDSGEIASINQFGAECLDFSPDELVGRTYASLHSTWVQDEVAAFIDACRAEPGIVHTQEFPKTSQQGNGQWTRDTARVVHDPDGKQMIQIVCQDVSSEYRLNEQLSHNQTHDTLTGLANRTEFDREIRITVAEAHVRHNCHVLCYADIDHFRVINETFGDDLGDQVLKDVAQRISEHLRQGDQLARLGNDNFGFLLRKCDLKGAMEVMRRIQTAVSTVPFDVDAQEVSIDLSIGATRIDETTVGASSALVNKARIACDTAKGVSSDKVCVFDEKDEEMLRRRGEMRWVPRLQQALDRDQFELFAQPIRCVATNSPDNECYEVLLRLRDAPDRLIPPGMFLPAAEQYGMSGHIDRWVVEHTLAWLADNPLHLRGLRHCGINLSGYSLTSDMADFIEDALVRYSIPANKICFEITETAAMRSLEAGQAFIDRIRGLGSRFALDDFGSGVSSFAYLSHLHVDFLKIDGQFVKDLDENDVHQSVIRAIQEVAGTLGIETIAEFVESTAIYELLVTLGVDHAQGYWIGRPDALIKMHDLTASSERSLQA